MKQLIVLLASIILGIGIVSALLIDDDSVFNSMKGLWQKEIEVRDMRNSYETISSHVCGFAATIDNNRTA